MGRKLVEEDRDREREMGILRSYTEGQRQESNVKRRAGSRCVLCTPFSLQS